MDTTVHRRILFVRKFSSVTDPNGLVWGPMPAGRLKSGEISMLLYCISRLQDMTRKHFVAKLSWRGTVYIMYLSTLEKPNPFPSSGDFKPPGTTPYVAITLLTNVQWTELMSIYS
ncbi:uncharacterized protein LOC117326884 [Pecten maximus]|uniref:uncharacterized protein LOC117326884 n=1 Tax=Pecten maximus TaxID=6579 RepID=UPI00145874A1|nr:uncharacterized protein LOC117326884 [Pecten maximus]